MRQWTSFHTCKCPILHVHFCTTAQKRLSVPIRGGNRYKCCIALPRCTLSKNVIKYFRQFSHCPLTLAWSAEFSTGFHLLIAAGLLHTYEGSFATDPSTANCSLLLFPPLNTYLFRNSHANRISDTNSFIHSINTALAGIRQYETLFTKSSSHPPMFHNILITLCPVVSTMTDALGYYFVQIFRKFHFIGLLPPSVEVNIQSIHGNQQYSGVDSKRIPTLWHLQILDFIL